MRFLFFIFLLTISCQTINEVQQKETERNHCSPRGEGDISPGDGRFKQAFAEADKAFKAEFHKKRREE